MYRSSLQANHSNWHTNQMVQQILNSACKISWFVSISYNVGQLFANAKLLVCLPVTNHNILLTLVNYCSAHCGLALQTSKLLWLNVPEFFHWLWGEFWCHTFFCLFNELNLSLHQLNSKTNGAVLQLRLDMGVECCANVFKLQCSHPRRPRGS